MKWKALLWVPVVIAGLSGCGKSIPDCADPAVQKTLTELLQKVPDQANEQIASALKTHFGNTATITINSELLNPKLDAISSIGKDKDAGINHCKAILSAETKRTVIATTTDESALMFMMNLQMLKQDDLDVLGKATGEKNKATFVAQSKLPSSLAYSANVTDKGDQILVTIDKLE